MIGTVLLVGHVTSAEGHVIPHDLIMQREREIK